MVPQVNIVNTAKYEVPKLFIQKASGLFFEYLAEHKVVDSANTYSLTIVFVGVEDIKDYNEKYRNKSVPTDVLSFCAMSSDESPKARKDLIHAEVELGDILICPDVVRDNSIRFGTKFEEELVRMIVHGILHLLGFDHVGKLGENDEEMFSIQESFMLIFKKAVS